MECSSVQIKLASTSLTFFNPRIFFKQIANNSRDSKLHLTQGGDKYLKNRLCIYIYIYNDKYQHITIHIFTLSLYYLSQFLHRYITTCLIIPSVISTFVRIHETHILEAFGLIGVEHSQQSLYINMYTLLIEN